MNKYCKCDILPSKETQTLCCTFGYGRRKHGTMGNLLCGQSNVIEFVCVILISKQSRIFAESF